MKKEVDKRIQTLMKKKMQAKEGKEPMAAFRS